MDLHRFINLLGKQRFEAVTDPALNALLVAWDVLKPGIAREFWKRTCLNASQAPPAARGRQAGASWPAGLTAQRRRRPSSPE